MGKKKNKKLLKAFFKGNKVLMAAIGGAAAGITIAGILGTAKAQEILKTVEDSVTNIGDKNYSNGTGSFKKDALVSS